MDPDLLNGKRTGKNIKYTAHQAHSRCHGLKIINVCKKATPSVATTAIQQMTTTAAAEKS